jgi:hypothetical protein
MSILRGQVDRLGELRTCHLAACLIPFLDATIPQAEQECYEQAEGTGRQAGWTAGQVT